jgi:hypothetical protein
MAAGDLVGDDLDTILDQYGAQKLDVRPFNGISHRPKGQLAQSEQSQTTTKRGSVSLLLASEFQLSVFVSFGGNLTHGKSIQ